LRAEGGLPSPARPCWPQLGSDHGARQGEEEEEEEEEREAQQAPGPSSPRGQLESSAG